MMQTVLSNGLIVKKFTWDIVDSNAYLIQSGKKGLLIDAVDLASLYKEIENLEELTIVLTHCHFDHICGLNGVRERLEGAVQVICTEKCSKKIGNAFRNMSSTANIYISFYSRGEQQGNIVQPFICKPADRVFQDRLMMRWNDCYLEMRAVYGHTDDGAIIFLDDKWLFSGDTLLPIPTTTRFPSGSKKRFWSEDIPLIEERKALIQTVFPGHGDIGKIQQMIEVNEPRNTLPLK